MNNNKEIERCPRWLLPHLPLEYDGISIEFHNIGSIHPNTGTHECVLDSSNLFSCHLNLVCSVCYLQLRLLTNILGGAPTHTFQYITSIYIPGLDYIGQDLCSTYGEILGSSRSDYPPIPTCSEHIMRRALG